MRKCSIWIIAVVSFFFVHLCLFNCFVCTLIWSLQCGFEVCFTCSCRFLLHVQCIECQMFVVQCTCVRMLDCFFGSFRILFLWMCVQCILYAIHRKMIMWDSHVVQSTSSYLLFTHFEYWMVLLLLRHTLYEGKVV